MLGKALDKLTLNTEIVSMRHATRRARVHVINKLVREARKLKNKKGTDDQRKKYQRKADRLTEEVLIIKKLKDDDISKFALSNTQALEEVISDATITLETRALAKLANHHLLKMRVNELRTKYPTWAETLPQLLPQLGAKRKKKGKEKNKRKDVTAESTMIKDSDHSDVKNNNGNNDKENSSLLEKNTESAKVKVSSGKRQKQKKTSKDESVFSESDQDADKNMEHKSQRHSGICEVKRFAELLKEEISESDDTESDNTSELHVAVESSKSDPFFLHGDDNGNDDDDGDDSSNDERMQDDKERKVKKTKEDIWGKSNQMGPNRRQRRQQLFGSKPTNVGFKNFQQKSKKGFVSRTTEHKSALGKKKEQHGALPGNDVTVHPSWEAKRKLKEQQQAIFSFQGKKIKFDDE